VLQLIPVIDLKGGRVVHARRGTRDTYAPIRSTLAAGAQPVEIATALLRLHPFQTLYLADLDAIQRRGDNLSAIEAVHAAFPAVELWVDAGIANLTAYSAWRARGLGRAVIGTECMPETDLIDVLLSGDHGWNPVLSLDFGPTGPLGPAELFERPDPWPKDVIAMTLARVGSNVGPDANTLAAIVEPVFALGSAHRVREWTAARDDHDTSAPRGGDRAQPRAQLVRRLEQAATEFDDVHESRAGYSRAVLSAHCCMSRNIAAALSKDS